MAATYVVHAAYVYADGIPRNECAGAYDRQALAERKAARLVAETGKPFHVDVWPDGRPALNVCPATAHALVTVAEPDPCPTCGRAR